MKEDENVMCYSEFTCPKCGFKAFGCPEEEFKKCICNSDMNLKVHSEIKREKIDGSR